MKRRTTLNRLSALLFPLALLPALGCGDDDEESARGGCGAAFQACGGDIAGTWEATDICSSDTLKATIEASLKEALGIDAPACDGVLESYEATPKGWTVSFANGQFTSNGAAELKMKLKITASCFSQVAPEQGLTLNALTCAAAGPLIQTTAAMEPGSGIDAVSCAFAAGACTCTTVGLRTLTSESAMYTLAGNTYVVNGNAAPYCVEGKTLRVQPQDPSGLVGTVVLRKR